MNDQPEPPEPSAQLDSRYVEARRVLLDALTALAPHGRAFIVAGAQAVYLHTGEADLAIAPFTTDADLALDPTLLSEEPKPHAAMLCADPAYDRRGALAPAQAFDPTAFLAALADIGLSTEVEPLPGSADR